MLTSLNKVARTVPLLLPLSLWAAPVLAEDVVAQPGVSIELSAAEARDNGCLLSFLAQNSHETDISSAIYETVLFGPEGGVSLLTLLDFQDLPAGRPRVRQFRFDDITCDQIGRILINGAETCETSDGPSDACMTGLTLNSRLKTEMIG